MYLSASIYNSKIKFNRYLNTYHVLEMVLGVRDVENETTYVPRLLNLVGQIYEQLAWAVLET